MKPLQSQIARSREAAFFIAASDTRLDVTVLFLTVLFWVLAICVVGHMRKVAKFDLDLTTFDAHHVFQIKQAQGKEDEEDS